MFFVLSDGEEIDLIMLMITSFSMQSVQSSQTSRIPFQSRVMGKEAVWICDDCHSPSGVTTLCYNVFLKVQDEVHVSVT